MKNNLKSKKIDVPYWLLAVLPLVLSLLVYPALPAMIPAHYGADNVVNRWGSKSETFILPVVILVLIAPVFQWLGSLSGRPDDAKGVKNQKISRVSGYVMMITFNILNALFLYADLQQVTNLNGIGFARILAAVLSIGQIILGNYLPKCKPNAYVGIRVPWTLKSEDVWYQTHRFSGKLDVLTGIFSLILSLALPQNFVLYVCIGLLFSACAAEVIYAYCIYSKLKRSGNH